MLIGVIRYWAGRPAAEHEVIARLSQAAQARGHQIIELNPDGTSLAGPAGTPRLDMVLNLHYASPKSLDVPHVGALWNPLEFYHKFGFVPHWANQLSHDHLASCGSPVVEAAIEPFRPDLFADGAQLPRLNHTVPERYLPPRRRTDRRLFYVGVNWEKLGNQAGRHDDLLFRLDAVGLTDIYGPRMIDGVAPWAGYATYRGDLPFDGWSVVEAIALAGSALVTSSPAHYRDGVMSSRPFEAAAAGVPIISERHPFMEEHFADAVLFYDERATAAEQAAEIQLHIARLNGDPDLALALGSRAQAIVRQQFSLDEQLDQLCTWVTGQQQAAPGAGDVAATVVLVPQTTPAAFADWVRRNVAVLSRFAHVVVAAPVREPAWQHAVDVLGARARVETVTRKDTGWSERAALAAGAVQGPVCFLIGVEDLYVGYPHAVVAAVTAAGTGIVPSVAVPTGPGADANARLPRLLCGSTCSWWDLAAGSVVTTGERVRELHTLLGPGLHLGVLAAAALEHDAEHRAYVPAFRLTDGPPSGTVPAPWSLASLAGAERHQDAAYAQSLPAQCADGLPLSVLKPEVVLHAAPMPLRTRVADAVRRSALPEPVVHGLIAAGRAALRPSRRPR